MTAPTHYCPWNESDEFAYCGHRMTEADLHSPQPTCPACAARIDALDRVVEDTPLPLDAEEARTELDPLLNAGLPALAPMSPFGADLFAYGMRLARATRRAS